jgi:L-lactate dehydrogenase
VWSLANIAGMRLPDFATATGTSYESGDLNEIFRRTRDAAYEIIKRKGATYFAVAAGLMRIVEAILRDQASVLSVSSLVTDYYGIGDICFSLPTVVDGSGVQRQIRLQLNQAEQEGLRNSASVLKKTADSLDLPARAVTR